MSCDNAVANISALSAKTRVSPTESVAPASVSIVIPCYNYATYLHEAVESALSQDGVDVDVIIVDDKSTDDSLAVATRIAAIDSRITVLAHEKNAGPVATFNDGLAKVRGEFLVRLDADDLLTPGSLRRAVAVMQRYPNVGLVYGHPIHFVDGARRRYRHKATSWTLWPGRSWLEARCRDGFNVITSPEVLMRRSVVDAVGGQMPLAHTHDMEMWLRMSAFCDVAYIHGADQAWHREHENSLSARHVDAIRDLLERKDAFDTLFRGKAAHIPAALQMHQMAKQSIAAQAVSTAIRQYDRGSPNGDEIAILIDLARILINDIETVPGWRGVQTRIAIGPKRARGHPVYLLERMMRGLRSRYSRWKWHRTGEW